MNRNFQSFLSRLAGIARGINQNTSPFSAKRLCSQSHPQPVTEEEIMLILRKKFPTSQSIIVEDISGGCGAMFNITVESNDFKGLSIVKQHRTVYDTLKQQISNIHGLHLETKIPT